MFSKLVRRLVDRPEARIGFITEPTAIAVDPGSEREVREISYEEWLKVAEKFADRRGAAQVLRHEERARALFIVDGVEQALVLDLDREQHARFAADFLGDGREDRIVVSTNDWSGKVNPPQPPLPPKPTGIVSRLEALLRIANLPVVDAHAK